MSACIEWTGSRNPKGYGQKKVGGKTIFAHRWAWEQANGPIPDGLHVLHTCDNPPCVNVDHLFLGTNADNVKDRDAKGRMWQQQKTHCPQGHPYSGENLYVRPDGSRLCRACQRAASREWHRAKARARRESR